MRAFDLSVFRLLDPTSQQATVTFAETKLSTSKDSARSATCTRAQAQSQPAVGQQATRDAVSQSQQQAINQQADSKTRHQPTGNSRQHQEPKQSSSAVRMPCAASASQPPPDTAASSSNVAVHTDSDRQQISSTEQSVDPSPSSHMSVTWLGTSSGNPSLRRNVSSIALCHGSCTYLVDCGEGTSRQVLRSNIDPASISAIYISHLHGDHCFGLPGMIELISEAHRAAGVGQGSKLLTIQGPPGVQQLVKGALAVSCKLCRLATSVTNLSVKHPVPQLQQASWAHQMQCSSHLGLVKYNAAVILGSTNCNAAVLLVLRAVIRAGAAVYLHSMGQPFVLRCIWPYAVCWNSMLSCVSEPHPFVHTSCVPLCATKCLLPQKLTAHAVVEAAMFVVHPFLLRSIMLKTWSVLQASTSALHVKLLVRDYTLDRGQARGPTPVDPTGLISFARQAPDADSKPDLNPRSRSRATHNRHSNLQVSMT